MKNKYQAGLVVLCLSLGLSHTAAAQRVTIDYGVGYSKRSMDRVGGRSNIENRISAGHWKMIRQNNNSGTLTTYGLKYRTLFPRYADNKPMGAVLNDWQNFRVGSTGSGQSQLSWARGRRLDLLSFVSVSGNYRGIAQGDYSVVTVGQINTHTLGHEIGHNLSATHAAGNRMVASGNNNLGRTRYTVMASGGRSNNDIIEYYSGPGRRFLGASTGNNSNKNNVGKIRNRRVQKSRNR